jgi:hypothetical protein
VLFYPSRRVFKERMRQLLASTAQARGGLRVEPSANCVNAPDLRDVRLMSSWPEPSALSRRKPRFAAPGPSEVDPSPADARSVDESRAGAIARFELAETTVPRAYAGHAARCWRARGRPPARPLDRTNRIPSVLPVLDFVHGR